MTAGASLAEARPPRPASPTARSMFRSPPTAAGQDGASRSPASRRRSSRPPSSWPSGGESDIQEAGDGEYFAVRVDRRSSPPAMPLDGRWFKPQLVRSPTRLRKEADGRHARPSADELAVRARSAKGESHRGGGRLGRRQAWCASTALDRLRDHPGPEYRQDARPRACSSKMPSGSKKPACPSPPDGRPASRIAVAEAHRRSASGDPQHGGPAPPNRSGRTQFTQELFQATCRLRPLRRLCPARRLKTKTDSDPRPHGHRHRSDDRRPSDRPGRDRAKRQPKGSEPPSPSLDAFSGRPGTRDGPRSSGGV